MLLCLGFSRIRGESSLFEFGLRFVCLGVATCDSFELTVFLDDCVEKDCAV
jgi:hypothetical protein